MRRGRQPLPLLLHGLALVYPFALTGSAAPRRLDFCEEACACPWEGKRFPLGGGKAHRRLDEGGTFDQYKPYPHSYVTHKVDTPPVIDGSLDDPAWEEAEWTHEFVDISEPNPGFPTPRFTTRAKMRWDDDFLYVGAYMEETDVWANMTESPSVIFNDNDFEVFVDAMGSNHAYKEFEMNAINSTWSLSLNRPYGDGGGENSTRVYPETGWFMEPPLYCRVFLDGPVNDPSTPNRYWSVEIALPLPELVYNQTGATLPPSEGDQWRINFSRVEWRVIVVDGSYWKDPAFPHEDNWVWTPQGRISMHEPEHWGFLQFSEEAPGMVEPAYNEEWRVRSVALALYWAEKLYREENGVYTDDLALLEGFTDEGLLDGTCTQVPTVDLSDDGTVYVADIADIVGAHESPYEARITCRRLLTVQPLPANSTLLAM